MYLSKAFNTINENLLFAKLNAYGVSFNAIKLVQKISTFNGMLSKSNDTTIHVKDSKSDDWILQILRSFGSHNKIFFTKRILK